MRRRRVADHGRAKNGCLHLSAVVHAEGDLLDDVKASRRQRPLAARARTIALRALLLVEEFCC